jgi:heme/copper-type cytochrome/quinol oxidase subunit 2
MEAITSLLSKFRIIFIALLLGQLLFLGVTIFLSMGAPQPADPKEGEIFLFIVPIVLVFGMTAGALISKQRLIQLQKSNKKHLKTMSMELFGKEWKLC